MSLKTRLRVMRHLLLCLVVLLAACGSDDGGSATTPAEELPGEPVCIGDSGEPAPDFVGLTEGAARDLAAERNLTVREVGRDGECATITMDLRNDRVNLEFVGDVVVGAAIY